MATSPEEQKHPRPTSVAVTANQLAVVGNFGLGLSARRGDWAGSINFSKSVRGDASALERHQHEERIVTMKTSLNINNALPQVR